MQKWIKVFDIVLYTSVAVLLLIGAWAQLGLRNKDTRAIFTSVDIYEGEVLSQIPKKELPMMTLALQKGEPTRDIKVLLNGEVIGDFKESLLVVPVSEPGLIEINAARTKGPVLVKVLECSSVLTPNLKGKILLLDRTIETLGEIEFGG